MFKQDERYEYRKLIIKQQHPIVITKEKLNLLYEPKIMFIEDSNDGRMYIMNCSAILLEIQLGNDISREDIYNCLPEYKKASLENQKEYIGINLGMGHALLIKTSVYEDYMNLLKSKIQYENQYEDCYNAYCNWMSCAIEYLKSNHKLETLKSKISNLDGIHCVIGDSYCTYKDKGYIDEFYIYSNEYIQIFYNKKTYNYNSFEKLINNKLFDGKSIKELIEKIHFMD